MSLVRLVCPKLQERLELGHASFDARSKTLAVAGVYALARGRWRGQYVQVVDGADVRYEGYDDVTEIVLAAYLGSYVASTSEREERDEGFVEGVIVDVVPVSVSGKK